MKNIYILVARSLETGKLVEVKRDSLSNIDHYTQRNSKESILINLLDEGRITSVKQDIYIIKKSGASISYIEPIYNNTRFSQQLEAFRNSKTERDKKTEAHKIINQFVRLIQLDPNYYVFVYDGYTNIFKRFYDYFSNRQLSYNQLISQQYRDGGWALTSYELLRNIVESINFYYEYIYNNPKALKEMKSIKLYQHDLNTSRNLSLSNMIIVPNRDYASGQISIFDDRKEITTIKLGEIIEELKKLSEPISSSQILKIEEISQEFYREVLQRESREMIRILNEYILSSKDPKDEKRLVTQLTNMNLINDTFVFIKLYNIIVNNYNKGDINGYAYRKTNS